MASFYRLYLTTTKSPKIPVKIQNDKFEFSGRKCKFALLSEYNVYDKQPTKVHKPTHGRQLDEIVLDLFIYVCHSHISEDERNNVSQINEVIGRK